MFTQLQTLKPDMCNSDLQEQYKDLTRAKYRIIYHLLRPLSYSAYLRPNMNCFGRLGRTYAFPIDMIILQHILFL